MMRALRLLAIGAPLLVCLAVLPAGVMVHGGGGGGQTATPPPTVQQQPKPAARHKQVVLQQSRRTGKEMRPAASALLAGRAAAGTPEPPEIEITVPPAAIGSAGPAQPLGAGCMEDGSATTAIRRGEWWVGAAPEGFPPDSDSASHAAGALNGIRRHVGCLRELAESKRRKWQWSTTKHIERGPDSVPSGRMIFIDLGCRWGDQVAMFSAAYPNGTSFEIWCFEPSPRFQDDAGEMRYIPKFTKSQRALQTWMLSSGKMNKKGAVNPPSRNQMMRFLPFAAGVVNSTATLTDNSVGSSIVAGRGDRSKDHKAVVHTNVVKVIDFPGWLASEVTHDDFVVLKMDIESMEFPVLHRLCASLRISLVDELLLECHFGVRGHRSSDTSEQDRRASQSQCNSIVYELRAKAGLTAILWTDLKGKALKTYSRFRNGFVPT